MSVARNTLAQRRAAIYVRVSSRTQEEEGTSLATQEAACRAHAAQHGYAVAEDQVYREVFTGVELWERSVLQRLREAVRRHDVDVAIVHAIDRLARDPVHLGVILSEADHAGVAVEFVTEPLDDSPEGQLIRFVRGYAAKIEHEKIKERMMRGTIARAQAGKLLHGPRPLYGYRWADDDKATYAEEPTAAAVVRRIFREAASGRPLRAIAADLMRDGIPTPGSGAAWYHRTVAVILHNEMYTGAAHAFRTRSTRQAGRQRNAATPREQWIKLPDGTVPPLVDVETFTTVQARLLRNQAQAVRSCANPERYLLRAGYVRCGACGSVCIVNVGDRRHPSAYRCNSIGRPGGACSRPVPSVRTDELDAIVWRRVESVLTRPSLVAAELESLLGDDPTAADLDALERQAADVRRKIGSYVEALTRFEGPARDAICEKLAGLERHAERLATERAELLGRRTAWQAAIDRLGDVEAWCHQVAANITRLSYEEKRRALEALGVDVRVFGAGHQPRYQITLSLPLVDSTSTG